MAITTEGPIKLYLEQPDGTTHELTGSLTEFEISQDVEIATLDRGADIRDSMMGTQTITANFTVIGDLYNIFKPNEFEKEVQKRNLAREWMCDWCGSPNTWIDRHCDSCGGARSFIYD